MTNLAVNIDEATQRELPKPPPCNVDFVIPPVMSPAAIWAQLCAEAENLIHRSPQLTDFVSTLILNREDFAHALAYRLASVLQDEYCDRSTWQSLILEAMSLSNSVGSNSVEPNSAEHVSAFAVLHAAQMDLQAVLARDPAADSLLPPFLYFKGYCGLQAHRIAHSLWMSGDKDMALRVQARISTEFDIDIHPAAVFGVGIMIDHASGIVIGETAKVGDYVSMLQGVTLGGTGKDCGDRHPKIDCGVLLGAGATVLGNIRVGSCARIGAGSVVLEDVPPHSTVVGVPAKVVRSRETTKTAPSLEMDHQLCCDDD